MNNHQKKFTKVFSIVTILVIFVFLCSCNLFSNFLESDFFNKNKEVNNVVNNVTNNIQENTVTIGNINIEDLEDLVITSSKKVTDACVGIVRRVEEKISANVYQVDEAIGSGVIYKREEIRENGTLVNYKYYVVTNRHVVTCKEDTNKHHIYAYIDDVASYFEMTILGYDEKVDLACGTFTYHKYIEPAKFGDSSKLERGSFAYAIGCPESFNYYNSLTFGVISSPIRYLTDDTDGDGVDDFSFEYIQHDVSINPGNSGGGLFNLAGELIGINTMKLVSTEIDNMGFSIPANIVNKLLTDYLEKGIKAIRPRLGVSGYEVCKLTDAIIAKNNLEGIPNIYNGLNPYGIYVESTVEHGTMFNINLSKGDIILEIDNIKITRNYVITSIFNSLTKYQVGDTVLVKYYDRSQNKIVTESVTLSDK